MNRLSPITAVALGLGILLSPDTMVLLGNFMGRTGWTGLGLLALNAAFFMGIALKMVPDRTVPSPTFAFIPLAVKGAAAIFLSTGVLVSSGFTFNEVFVHWVPNFGFAFLLLAIVLGIHLSGTTTALKAQILFAGLALACLFILIFSGVGKGINPAPVSAPGLEITCLPLILWIGFDLALEAPGQRSCKAAAIWVILGAGMLFILWGLVSITHVPLEKLSASNLPHMKTASSLLGQTGRPIMGAAVILGTLSAVNALFLACRYTARRLTDQGLLPLWIRNKVFVPLVTAAIIGIMMASGMAGSDRLEVWIRAVFLLWLLTYARAGRSPGTLFMAVILTASVVGILYYGDRPGLTGFYMVLILIPGFIPGLIFKLIPTNKQRSLL